VRNKQHKIIILLPIRVSVAVASTLQDLSVYLSKNLTKPERACGFKGFLSFEWDIKCLENLGFTKPCA
jgi:hypothetical protein